MNSNSEILFASLESTDYKRGYEDCKKEYQSRTCENCKHASLYADAEDGAFCELGSMWCKVDLEFGCNQFERKD